MIEPPKASKGRRMSKKSRKKSPKTASRAKTPAKPATAKARAPKSHSKTRRAMVSKTRKSAASGPSHKAASKMLKSSDAARPKAADGKGSAVEKSPALVEGAKAPNFRLPRDGGDSVALSDFSGKKLVLFFYPKADTPGCTREAIDFTRLARDFAASGTAVLGISADSQRAQESFRDKHKLSVPLISDEKHQMLEAYGAWGEKSMYGRTFLGIIRTTVLVGGDGRVARIWRHVRVDGHADQVLEAARGL
jgi:thioredoxin-dependent peroxiredoxin